MMRSLFVLACSLSCACATQFGGQMMLPAGNFSQPNMAMAGQQFSGQNLSSQFMSPNAASAQFGNSQGISTAGAIPGAPQNDAAYQAELQKQLQRRRELFVEAKEILHLEKLKSNPAEYHRYLRRKNAALKSKALSHATLMHSMNLPPQQRLKNMEELYGSLKARNLYLRNELSRLNGGGIVGNSPQSLFERRRQALLRQRLNMPRSQRLAKPMPISQHSFREAQRRAIAARVGRPRF